MKQYQEKEWLNEKYWKEGLNGKEIAKLLGVHHQVIYYWMEKLDIPRRTASEVQRGRKNSMSGRTREQNPSWKGGRYTSCNGYVYVHKPNHPSGPRNNYVREHRLVMEKHLGRYLESWELVHHKNGIKDDNRPKNLKLVTRRNHTGQLICPHCKGIVNIR